MRRPRVLHLVHRMPYPPDKGDRIRSFHTLQFLACRCDLSLATLADEPVTKEAESVLQDLCVNVSIQPISKWKRWPTALLSMLRGQTITAGAFHSKPLQRAVHQWHQQSPFDFCLASASSMIPYLRRSPLKDVPAIVDLVDVDSQKWFDYAEASRGPKRWLYQTEGKQLRRIESQLPSWTHGILLTTQREVDLYESYAGTGTATVMENGVDFEKFAPVPLSEERSCAFVGAMDYRPNVDGMLWFSEKVWPRLKEREPDAKLYIVGRNPTPEIAALSKRAGIEVTGTVPDVRPYVERAGIIIVPLHIARGVQNKVLEALAMSKAVIGTPTCLGGLSTIIGQDLLAATEVEEWLTAIQQLWNNPQQREQLGRSGRAYVETHHSWESCLQPLETLIAQSTSDSG